MPKYQFVPIARDGRCGEPVAVTAYDDAVAMKRALRLPGAVAWDIWRGVTHVGQVAGPQPLTIQPSPRAYRDTPAKVRVAPPLTLTTTSAPTCATECV